MRQESDKTGPGNMAAQRRAARLAAALKDNMARRKAQVRARAADPTDPPDGGQDLTPGPVTGGQHQTE